MPDDEPTPPPEQPPPGADEDAARRRLEEREARLAELRRLRERLRRDEAQDEVHRQEEP